MCFLISALLVLAGAAHAQDRLGTAAESLRSNPVYVDPEAERAISAGEAERLRRAIAREDAGPLYLAILPAAAAEEAGGDPEAALLEEGRWAMEAAKAEMAGRPAPQRRPPCFFDPRHGPSVTDVEWSPPGGEPRPVPACAADAVRIRDGEDPNARRVPVNGELVPYWQAGPAFGPWAGGFFGGGLFPGLFIGPSRAAPGAPPPTAVPWPSARA